MNWIVDVLSFGLVIGLLLLIFFFFVFVLGRFDVKEYVTGFGNPEWRRSHEPASKSAVVVSLLLKNGASCVGKTVMDEFSFGSVIYEFVCVSI